MTERNIPQRGRRFSLHPDRIAYPIFLLAAVLAPLPLGSNRLCSESVLSLVIGALLAILGCATLIRPGIRRPMPFEIFGATILFGGTVLWAALQTTAYVPDNWAHPIWGIASETLDETLASVISLAPYSSWTEIMRLLLYGGAFALAYTLCQSPERAQTTLYVLAIVGGLYALIGFVLFALDLDLVGARVEGDNFASLSSTFPNHSHYAAYAGLGLLVAMALLFRDVVRRIPRDAERRETARAILECVLGTRAWLTATCLALAAAITLSNSRAGLLSAAIGLFLLFGALGLTNRYRSMRIGMTAGIFAILAVVAAVTFGNSLDRRLNATSESASVRMGIYAIAVENIEESPWIGTGLGSFPEVYKLHRVPGQFRYYDRAHNSYLELASDLGLPAAIAFFLGLELLALLCMRGVLRRRRNAVFPCIAVAATGQVAAHSLFDFPLQIPAIAVTFAILLGIGCAQSIGRSDT
jgi:O-antigen ligase